MAYIPHPHDADEPHDDSLVDGEAIRDGVHLWCTFKVTPGFHAPDGWEPAGFDAQSMTLTIDGEVELEDEDEIREALKLRGIDMDEMIDEAREEARNS